MEINYDADADAMYIRLRKGKFDHNKKVDKNTIVNYDKKGDVLGIELLFVKETNPKLLRQIAGKDMAVA